jgi:1-acyl-sn-glycerol-3-phosphate acyltransferase
MILLALISALPFYLCAILPAQKRHCIGVFWSIANIKMLSWFIGLKYEVKGSENIPLNPAIICCKHQSGWETYALQAIFPHQVFIAKKELLWIPILGQFLLLVSPIIIDRQKPAEANKKLIEQGKARKASGFWITIFPEGTRIKPGQKGKYKLGAARMAVQLEMDIVPVACNSGRLWPKNSFLKYPGLITVCIGPAIDYRSGTAEELMRQCEHWIEAQQHIIDVPPLV